MSSSSISIFLISPSLHKQHSFSPSFLHTEKGQRSNISSPVSEWQTHSCTLSVPDQRRLSHRTEVRRYSLEDCSRGHSPHSRSTGGTTHAGLGKVSPNASSIPTRERERGHVFGKQDIKEDMVEGERHKQTVSVPACYCVDKSNR